MRKWIAAATVAVAMTGATAATAAEYAYMTGTSAPWSETTNEAAMDAAFGASAWTRFGGFDSSVFNSGYAFVFLDGSDNAGQELGAFLGSNLGALETFVTSGGRVLLNAARNDAYNEIATGFGTSLTGELFSNSVTMTAAGIAAGLDGNGAGTTFGGNSFGHDIVAGASVCYIESSLGCVFGAVTQGLFVGGQTTSGFHSGSDPFQLRVNQLQYAATGAVVVGEPGGVVPEPATWALMIGGFGLAGATLRRRKLALA
jgi:hypothetical protein